MKLRLKEDPREWRKSVLLTALGLALVSTALRWRGVFSNPVWLGLLGVFALASCLACLRPRWFRGFYRLSMRAGVALSLVVARIVLSVIFVVVLTPLGLLLRLAGKDLLRLKPGKGVETYWEETRPSGPLDRMF